MRLTIDEWAMQLAQVCAQRSTCCRRHVGCVLLDSRKHVLATGYNGVASGLPHCNEVTGEKREEDLATRTIKTQPIFGNACTGATLPSGEGLDLCEAIHAEQNALLQCADVNNILYCYTTTSPCVTCTKLLLNTGCRYIYFLEEYTKIDSKDLWVKAGRVWRHLPSLNQDKSTRS